jgi:hypothetical protein
MLEKQERIAVLILLIVLMICGIGTLVLDGMGKVQFAQNYTLQSPEGTLVAWDGIVQKVTLTGSGSGILLVNGVQVFLSSTNSGSQVQEGDLVNLYGTVQIYKGKREILVSNPDDFRIITGSQGRDLRF